MSFPVKEIDFALIMKLNSSLLRASGTSFRKIVRSNKANPSIKITAKFDFSNFANLIVKFPILLNNNC